jgi:hypothetical protein
VDPKEKSSCTGCKILSTKVVREIAAGARLTPNKSKAAQMTDLPLLGLIGK